MQRRQWIRAALAGGLAPGLLAGCASAPEKKSLATVVVVGGGFGGATAAKYLKRYSRGSVRVLLVEPAADFISCPMSNLVLAGMRKMADITRPYATLAQKHGVEIVRDRVTRLDPQARKLTLASGTSLDYDKLVLSPGIDLMSDRIEGLATAQEAGLALHAWKAGPQTTALRTQLEAMPDGGVYALTIPEAPYRCPPGPYERASLVAAYFKKAKPRSKVLVLDANADITSKGALFRRVWQELYPGLLEYRPQHRLAGVDGKAGMLRFEVQEDLRADVLNVLPPMRAGEIAVQSGLANANERWCHVHFLNFESTAVRHVHILGDAVQAAPGMPKSGHMANAQAKVAAAQIVAELMGLDLNPDPLLMNACLSFVDETRAMHVASVHRYNVPTRTYMPVEGAGGLSAAPSEQEGRNAVAWARNIWADMLA